MGKHEKTRKAIFADPVRSNIAWKDVLGLFRHLGAEIDESAEGSRVGVKYNGQPATFHVPHPGKAIGKPTVRSLRDFLTEAEGAPTAEGEDVEAADGEGTAEAGDENVDDQS